MYSELDENYGTSLKKLINSAVNLWQSEVLDGGMRPVLAFVVCKQVSVVSREDENI